MSLPNSLSEIDWDKESYGKQRSIHFQDAVSVPKEGIRRKRDSLRSADIGVSSLNMVAVLRISTMDLASRPFQETRSHSCRRLGPGIPGHSNRQNVSTRHLSLDGKA
jgi:hypothetical protein